MGYIVRELREVTRDEVEALVAYDPYEAGSLYGIDRRRFLVPEDGLAEEIVDWQGGATGGCRNCDIVRVQGELDDDPIATVKDYMQEDAYTESGYCEVVFARQWLEVDEELLVDAIMNAINSPEALGFASLGFAY